MLRNIYSQTQFCCIMKQELEILYYIRSVNTNIVKYEKKIKIAVTWSVV